MAEFIDDMAEHSGSGSEGEEDPLVEPDSMDDFIDDSPQEDEPQRKRLKKKAAAASEAVVVKDDLVFKLQFLHLSLFNQLVDIIGNLSDLKTNMLTFDIIVDEAIAFEGVAISQSSSSNSSWFFARLDCNILKKPQTPADRYFTVNMKNFIGFLHHLDPTHVLTIEKKRGDDRLTFTSMSPAPNDAGAIETYSMNEIAETCRMDETQVAYFQNMQFDFLIRMQTEKLKGVFARASANDIETLYLKLEEHVIGSGEKLPAFAVEGMDKGKTCGMRVCKIMGVATDENNKQVYDSELTEVPSSFKSGSNIQVVQEVAYTTKQLYEVVKNMKKQQNVSIAFGRFKTIDADGDEVVNDEFKPCLIDYSLGNGTCYLRFILTSLTDEALDE